MDIEEIFKTQICDANCGHREVCRKDLIMLTETRCVKDPEIILSASCLKYKPIKYIRRSRYEKVD